jgi:dTMP kinase
MNIDRKIINNFIVIEGIDGSGKSMQAQLLKADHTWLTAEPTHSDIGMLIRKTLGNRSDVSNDGLAWLFAADRYEHVYGKDGIIEHLHRGELVVSDRYLFSSLAYQKNFCSDPNLPIRLSDGIPLPQLVIFLDASVDVALDRIAKNRSSTEIFETENHLKKIRHTYADILYDHHVRYPKMHIAVIDADRSQDQVHEAIVETLRTEAIIPR